MKISRFWAAGWLAACLISASAWAGYVPETIQYEGTVLDEFGQPGSGTRSFMFMLHDTNTLLRWVEELNDVPLNPQGAFQVLLGKTAPLPAIDPSWRLTVTMKSGNAPWKEVTPPQTLTAVFYALQAEDARRVPNDLVVRQDLRVEGELKMQGILSVTNLNVGEVSADSISISQLTVSELSGPTNSPISISGELETTQRLVLKGSVSMMTVMDMNYTTVQGLSGRYYVLAITRDDLNLGHIVVTSSGARRTYTSNMPNGNYFLPLDLNRGDLIQLYDKRGEEIPVGSWTFSQIFRTIKLIQMHR